MNDTKNITRTALWVTVAVLLGYIESLFPPIIPVPGIKLGLSNIVIVLLLYTESKKTLSVTLLKVVLCALLFGTPTSFIYSISGAAVSLLVMTVAKKTNAFSFLGVSSLGGIFHNAAQLVCAYIIIGKGALFHIPLLSLAGALCGLLIGIGAKIIIRKGGNLFGQK